MPHRVKPSSLVSPLGWQLQPSICHQCLSQTRSFSSTNTTYAAKKPKRNPSQARQAMFRWLDGPGKAFLDPLPGSTNYMGAYNPDGHLIRELEARKTTSSTPEEQQRDEDKYQTDADGNILLDKDGERISKIPSETLEDRQPFRLNRHFRSEPVLSESLRNEIYRRITEGKETFQQISYTLKVTVERVAAVYRLKEVEKHWVEEGKKLETSYGRVVMGMLPQTPYNKDQAIRPHESINDLPVHPATLNQIFYPTSESRQFNRVDAGRVFDSSLKAPEQRVPHPEMVEYFKDEAAGYTQSERGTRLRERFQEIEANRQSKLEKARLAEERHTKVVLGRRWDFKFRDANAEDAGKDGRGRYGVGWRYGQPFLDRKKDQVRIPTRVE